MLITQQAEARFGSVLICKSYRLGPTIIKSVPGGCFVSLTPLVVNPETFPPSLKAFKTAVADAVQGQGLESVRPFAPLLRLL
jgi:hypothetical protein